MKWVQGIALGLALAPLAGCGDLTKLDQKNPVVLQSLDPETIEDAPFDATMRAQVLFLAEQYSLTPEARAELDRQAAWFAQHPTTTAVIEGHADEVGTRDYNIGLGERRAVAVREYLISKGVTASRLTTASFGKERPRAVCSDESCYAKNRRVETVVTTPAVADPVVAPSDAPIGVFVPFDPVPEAS